LDRGLVRTVFTAGGNTQTQSGRVVNPRPYDGECNGGAENL